DNQGDDDSMSPVRGKRLRGNLLIRHDVTPVPSYHRPAPAPCTSQFNLSGSGLLYLSKIGGAGELS
ncbi:MAG TPA: hypothetical protein VMS71_05500, partial [Candidatus Acidoferrum sp.]|nr:hypothetical protein [Candidatus Acidoferrum sp.]